MAGEYFSLGLDSFGGILAAGRDDAGQVTGPRAARPMPSAPFLPPRCSMTGTAAELPTGPWAGLSAPQCTSPHTKSLSSRRNYTGFLVPGHRVFL
jgi:hypothetical protein